MSDSFALPFVKKEQIAKNTWTFFFDRSVVPSYTFFPGQYTKITLPIFAKDGKGSYRFFTTASSPLNKEFLEITTSIDPDLSQRSDFKQALFNLEEGQEVEFYGPMGGFYLDESDVRERILLAGGIGVTPFYSMILYAAEKNLSLPITLIASFSTREDMIFKKKLEQAAEKNKMITVMYITERLNEKILQQVQHDNALYMVSGLPEMIDNTVEMLERMGIEETKIKTDIFTGY